MLRAASATRSLTVRNAASARTRAVTSIETPSSRVRPSITSRRARCAIQRSSPFLRMTRNSCSIAASLDCINWSFANDMNGRSSGCISSSHSSRVGTPSRGSRSNKRNICAFQSPLRLWLSRLQTPSSAALVATSRRLANSAAWRDFSTRCVTSNATPTSSIATPLALRRTTRRVSKERQAPSAWR